MPNSVVYLNLLAVFHAVDCDGDIDLRGGNSLWKQVLSLIIYFFVNHKLKSTVRFPTMDEISPVKLFWFM